MKNYLIALLTFLVAPIFAFAALDVTLSGSTIVNVGGYNLVVSGSANIDSIIVDTSSFSVQLSPGASLTVTSADRKAFSVSPNTYTTSTTCINSESSVTLSMSSGSATTVVVTPSSAVCAISGGGGGISGGGGGGSIPTPVYTVIPGTASSASSAVSSSSSSNVSVVTKPIVLPKGLAVALTKTLKLGSENSEVKSLQQALAQDKTIYPEGKATGYYGTATRNAIKRFQKKYGIEQTGNVGPLTRKKLNEIYGTQTTQTSSSAGSSISSQSISKEERIKQIQTLIQQLLEQVKVLRAKEVSQ
ncbi:MAG: peptidoglycan-binding domain-containing protein [Patescibacteria group bacterium]